MRYRPTLALCGVVMAIASTVTALPSRSFEQAELFATCSGRHAALAARLRGYDEGNAAPHDRLRHAFDELLGAVLPHAVSQGVPESEARKWHGRGWAEVAGLLAERHYAPDTGRSARSQAALDRRMAACRNVLL